MQRIGYLDTLKGIAILCIMLLHYENGVFPDVINNLIGSFMITAFYVSSGIIYSMKSESENIDFIKLAQKRFKQLIVPYFIFSAIIIAFDTFLWVLNERELIWLAKEVYYTITFRGIGTLWFLPVLFIAELAFVKIKRMSKLNHILINIVVVYCLANNFIVPHYADDGSIKMACIRAFILTIERVIIAVLVLSLTFMLHKALMNRLKVDKYRCLFGFIFIIVGALFVIFAPRDMFSSPILNLTTFIFLPYGVALILSVGRANIFGNMFQWFGKNSLIVMVTHYSFLLELCNIFNTNVLGGGDITGVRSLIYFLISVIIEIPIIIAMNTYCGLLLGKR